LGLGECEDDDHYDRSESPFFLVISARQCAILAGEGLADVLSSKGPASWAHDHQRRSTSKHLQELTAAS